MPNDSRGGEKPMIPISRILFTSFLISLTLTSCSQSSVAPSTSSPTSTPNSPVSTQAIYDIDTSLTAKSIIVPAEPEIELAFITSGYIEHVNVQIGDTVHAGDTLIQLDTVVLAAQLARAESAVKAAKAEYEYRKSLAEKPSQPSEILKLQAAVELAVANVVLAEADLVVTQNMLKQTTLNAPIDGTILDVQAAPGEMVNNGRTVIKMVDLKDLQVETIDLREIDVPRIYIEQPVSVYIYALNMNVEGVVIKISPQATLTGENRVYKVSIRLNDQPKGLMWGMSAETKFIVDE
jgi:membrane fusion protein, multidrug efflux system